MRWLIVVLLLLLPAVSLRAQLRHHEVYGSYGFGPAQTLNILNVGSGSSAQDDSRDKHFGPVGVGYRYFISEKVAVGLHASYLWDKAHYTYTGFTSISDNQYLAILPRFDFYYVRQPSLRIYSGVSLGVCFKRTEYTYENWVNGSPPSRVSKLQGGAQLQAIGVRIGNRLAFFAELGYGNNGIAQTGLAFRP